MRVLGRGGRLGRRVERASFGTSDSQLSLSFCSDVFVINIDGEWHRKSASVSPPQSRSQQAHPQRLDNPTRLRPWLQRHTCPVPDYTSCNFAESYETAVTYSLGGYRQRASRSGETDLCSCAKLLQRSIRWRPWIVFRALPWLPNRTLTTL